LVESAGHGHEFGELVADGTDVSLFEDCAAACDRKGVIGKDVPRAEYEIRQAREREQVVDERDTLLGALPEPDGSKLRQGADGRSETTACEQAPRDERRGDGAEARQKHTELPARRRNLPRRSLESSCGRRCVHRRSSSRWAFLDMTREACKRG